MSEGIYVVRVGEGGVTFETRFFWKAQNVALNAVWSGGESVEAVISVKGGETATGHDESHSWVCRAKGERIVFEPVSAKASYCVTLNRSVMGMMPTLERARAEAIRLACANPNDKVEVTVIGDDGQFTWDGNAVGAWWQCETDAEGELVFARGRSL